MLNKCLPATQRGNSRAVAREVANSQAELLAGRKAGGVYTCTQDLILAEQYSVLKGL